MRLESMVERRHGIEIRQTDLQSRCALRSSPHSPRSLQLDCTRSSLHQPKIYEPSTDGSTYANCSSMPASDSSDRLSTQADREGVRGHPVYGLAASRSLKAR
jgi:hypothetical protein